MADRDSELQVCLSAIRSAGDEIMKRYASFERIADAPADISTDADRASQRLIFERLHEAFPNDCLRGEESTPDAPQGQGSANGRLWIVDPIDGTRGFARKNDEFSVMIGLVEGGRVVLGAVYEPAIDRLTHARKGSGCFVEQSGRITECRVTSKPRLADSIMSISRSQKEAGRRRLLESFGARDAVETYSAGIKLAQVARGETDVYVGDYLTLKDWDVCAGHILVEEAGGAVTDVDGGVITYDGTGRSLRGRGILASNGRIHDACLDVLRERRYTFD